MRSEFEITIEQGGAIALPIGATGYMSKQIWEEMLADYSSYFGSEDNIKLYKALGDENLAPEN